MSSTYGENLKLSIFGQSHGAAIGMTLDGIPAGLAVDLEELQAFLNRHHPKHQHPLRGLRQSQGLPPARPRRLYRPNQIRRLPGPGGRRPLLRAADGPPVRRGRVM